MPPYAAINQAIDVVKNTGNLSVPLDIRNAPTKLMKDLGYGESYKYAHNYDLNFVAQEFLPKASKIHASINQEIMPVKMRNKTF